MASVKKCLKILFQALLVLTIYFVLFKSPPRTTRDSSRLATPSLSHVILHLDLKGMPPRLAYLESLLPMLREYGVTGLLIEYEDMFPYDGPLEALRTKGYYKKKELSHFILKAVEFGLEVIPLVQTFGHMEYVLKLKQFARLREARQHSDSLCPTAPGSGALVRRALRQVIDFHKSLHQLKYFHIGCDEVLHINTCSRCLARNLTTGEIFLHHVTSVSSAIKSDHPDITVLIWDDMLPAIKPLTMKKFNLRFLVEPVVWDYSTRINIAHSNIYKYYTNFNNIWIASAFKGALREDSILPDIHKRVQNHYSWINFISDYKMAGKNDVFKFKGIFITGWSRYNHFKPLCEILPVSIPSLLICLLLIKEFNNSNVTHNLQNEITTEKRLFEKIHTVLNCSDTVAKNVDKSFENCNFSEGKVYQYLSKLDDDIASKRFQTAIHNFTQLKKHTIKILTNRNETRELMKIKSFLVNLTNELSLYFDDKIVEDYLQSKLQTYNQIVNSMF